MAGLLNCTRQAPTNPARPSINGVQKPPWANGRKSSVNNSATSRNSTPPSHCTAMAVNTKVRDGRRRPTNNVINPANAQLIVVPSVKKNSGASR
ncbi:hypothetical protein D3C87_1307440 [compost metagenome]